MHDEGVIKFQVEHRQLALSPRRYGELAAKLIAWREILASTGLVGQDPVRYGGAGYGNVSARLGAPASPRGARPFLITGTQTSGLARVGLEQLCVVRRYELGQNRAFSEGSTHPSSESLTHGAIYDLSPHIRAVLHAHAPVIWRRARALRLPMTDASAAYGTTAIAYAAQQLYRESALPETRALAMGGHEDGVIVFGKTVQEAGNVLISLLARAYEQQCAGR
jgi:ribulose-5-phosphate 4-epimerase/fuculose-1-phosphate aldolase